MASAAALAIAFLAAGCQKMEPAKAALPAAQALDSLIERCVEAMTREACIAQRDTSPNSSTPAAAQVFVAGVGAIDAQAYSEIRAAGEAMCNLVKDRCVQEWNGGACQAARSLWPATSQLAR